MATNTNKTGAAGTLLSGPPENRGKKPFKDAAPSRDPETLSPRHLRKLRSHHEAFAADLAARLPGALACACMAVAAGVQIIRAHDVAETVQAIRMTEAILANQRP